MKSVPHRGNEKMNDITALSVLVSYIYALDSGSSGL